MWFMVAQSHEVKDRSTPYLLMLFFVFLAAGIVAIGSLYDQSQMQWWTVLLMGVLLFGAGASVGLIWGRKRVQFYKERSKMEEAVRESEAKFRALFEQATDGMALVDVETRRFILTNRQMQKALGYSEKALLRLTVPDDIHPADDLPRILDLFERLARHEITMASNVPIKRKDGTVFFADISATPICFQQRNCLFGVFRDITERRRIEEALRESEERYKTLFDEAMDGTCLADAETGLIIDCNQALADLVGRERAELLGQSQKILHPPDADQSAYSPTFRQHLTREEGHTLETQVITRTGIIKEVEIKANHLNLHGRKMLQGIFRDITERKRVEEALRRSETQVHTILESTADGILAVDSKGKVIKANRRFADLWRIPQSLMEGGDDNALLDFVLDQLSNPDTFLKKVRALYKSDALDMDTLIFKDGRVFERYSSPMIMEGGVIGRVWSFRDITEQRRLQQKRFQSQKMEAIGQLTAGIAHEFNNLLTSILGYSNLALMRLPSDSPLRRDLEQVERAGTRAAALTRQLLTFGRKYPQELKSINLNTIVLDMQRMLQPLLGSTIRLTASLDPALGIVIADPAQMEQIIMNMAVNARDAMPHGGELAIATANVHLDKNLARRHPESVPGSYIRLTVSDTGVGMSDDVKARLFDPFFTTKEVGQGTGLGLATCIGIIKQTGGFIDVDSAPGKGTTFQVFLPQADAAGATQPRNP